MAKKHKILSYSLPLLQWGQSLLGHFSNRRELTILTFHDVPEQKLEELRDFFLYLKSHFPFVGPEEFEQAILCGMPPEKNALFVTFDDGFKSSFTAWNEVLRPLDIRAAFFVCPSFIGPSSNFSQYVSQHLHMGQLPPEQVAKHQAPMHLEDLHSLQAQGNKIGCHSFNHANLASLKTDQERHYEIVESRRELEKKLGTQIDWFAYPFGEIKHIDSQSLVLISQHYKLCFSSIRGSNQLPCSPHTLRRQNINIHIPLKDQRYFLWKGADWRYQKKRRALDRLLAAEN